MRVVQDNDVPTSDFADLADAAFVASQVIAIRIDTMRSLIGEGIGKGQLEEKVAEAEAQGRRLGELFRLLYALAPQEERVRRVLLAILDGDREPGGSQESGIRMGGDAA